MVSHSDTINSTNNSDDELDKRIEMNDLCVRSNEDSAKQYMPQNGEYQIGGSSGSCNYCINCEPYNMDTNFGCQGGIGCAGGGGYHPNYRRTSYSANKDDCCKSSGAKTIGDRTCDPKYNAAGLSKDCSDTFSSFCVNSALKTRNCKDWSILNKDAYNSRITDYCGENLSDSWCQDQMTILGGIDTKVRDYCSLNKSDPFCNCYTALAASSNEGMNAASAAALSRPECYVKSCSSGTGYKTTNMRTSGECPAVNLCNNIINLNDSVNIALTDIAQSCEQSQSQSTSQSTSQAQAQAQQNNTFINKIKTKWNSFNVIIRYLIIFLVILFIGLSIGGLAMLIDDDNENNTIIADQHIMDMFAKYNTIAATH